MDCVSVSPSCLREFMVRVRVMVSVNPYPNPNQSEESHSNQSEARTPDLSYEKKYRFPYLLCGDPVGDGLLHRLPGDLAHHHVGEAVQHLTEQGHQSYLELRVWEENIQKQSPPHKPSISFG